MKRPQRRADQELGQLKGASLEALSYLHYLCKPEK